MGMGFAATRDIVSFLRRETADAAGTANPVAGHIDYAVSLGVTISCISASTKTKPAAWCSTG